MDEDARRYVYESVKEAERRRDKAIVGLVQQARLMGEAEAEIHKLQEQCSHNEYSFSPHLNPLEPPSPSDTHFLCHTCRRVRKKGE